jgi:hypothetical protein
MPTSNTQMIAHLEAIRNASNASINTVVGVRQTLVDASKELSDEAMALTLPKITTVPAVLQHPSNCTLCVNWDGS